MKNIILIFIIAFAATSTVCAQNIFNLQKLRGEVISSEPDNLYSTHAYNAFDTNKSTSFKSRDFRGWIGLDLKDEYAIRRIRVYPRSDRPERLQGAVLQGADNPQFNNAVDLYTITEIPLTGRFTTYIIQSEQTFRYVRCFSPDRNCNLAELEFYTDKGAQTAGYPQLTNLPTIYLETEGYFDFVNKENYAASNVIVSNGASVKTYSAGVKGRGNSTWQFMDKKSFRIKFDSKQNFLGLPASSKNWTLIASAVDKTLLRNGLAFEISKFLGFEFTPACVHVDVVLDGFYYGTYFVSDHLEVNKNRIDIDEMTASDIRTPNVSGGYHLEIDAYANEEPVYFYTNSGVPISIKSPDDDVIQPRQKEWITNHINQLESTLFTNPNLAVEKYIDIESAVKYYLHSELTGNCDSYWCIHTYKKRGDDKLYFGPVWDYDQAFLTNNRVPRFAFTLDTGHGVAMHWFRIIMQTAAAQNVLRELWKKVKKEDLEGKLISYLDEKAEHLQQSQTLNFQRWNSMNVKVWFEDALFDTYNEYIEFVKGFIRDRFNWFDEFAPIDKIDILPASNPGNPAKEWRYVTSAPSSNRWYLASYDDSSWNTGFAPFGTEQNLQNTFWFTNEIYIRTQFEVEQSDLDSIDRLYLYLFHDEDCWVYLNNELVLALEGYITHYKAFEIDKSKLKPQTNSIAIKCTQTTGGQLIDAGIYGTAKETEISICTPEKQTYKHNVKNGVLFIYDVEINSKIALYSIDGKLIKQEKAVSSDIQIQLPAKGVYLARLNGETIKATF